MARYPSQVLKTPPRRTLTKWARFSVPNASLANVGPNSADDIAIMSATRCVSSNDGAYCASNCAADTANIGSCASSRRIGDGRVHNSRHWHVASAEEKGETGASIGPSIDSAAGVAGTLVVSKQAVLHYTRTLYYNSHVVRTITIYRRIFLNKKYRGSQGGLFIQYGDRGSPRASCGVICQ